MIYVFLANGFEEVEALAPIDLLRRAGKDVKLIGIGGNAITSSHGVTVRTDHIASEVVLGGDLEMVILPGGMPGTLNLESNEVVQTTIDYCVDHGIYLAAICAAPSILGHKGLLEGKEAICYPGFEDQLGGAILSHTQVVQSDKIITAQGMGVAVEFGLKLVEILEGKAKAMAMAAAICDPSVHG